MSTFVIFYTGQFRFFECIDLHKDVISGNSGIYAGLSTTITESWQLPLSARHSVYPDKTLDKSLDEFKNKNFINSIFLDNDIKNVIPEHTSIEFFPCEYFFTLGSTIQDTESDYVVVMTTDLIFTDNKENVLKNIIDNLLPSNIPTAYVQYTNISEKNQMSTFLFVLNKEAIQLIKSQYIDAIKTFLKEYHKYKLSNEYATLRLLKLCKINIEYLKTDQRILRFRSTMDFDNISQLNFTSLLKLSVEYSMWKKQKLSEKWKRNV